MDLEASMIQVDLEKKREEIVWQEIVKYPRIHTGKQQAEWSEDLAEEWKIPVFFFIQLILAYSSFSTNGKHLE